MDIDTTHGRWESSIYIGRLESDPSSLLEVFQTLGSAICGKGALEIEVDLVPEVIFKVWSELSGAARPLTIAPST